MSVSVKNFIEQQIDKDLEKKTYGARVATRFPPEPNGYLHIGHAKSICLNFTLAEQYGGTCNLRFDDTNPDKEDTEFVNAIKEDVSWLGFKWDNLHYTSEYFEQLFEFAIKLIKQGDAFVCDLTAEQMREYRGTLTEPGKESPYRNRSVDENMKLFLEMKEGLHPEGSRLLRAKIDMSAGNINMRDPAMYRIMHKSHQHVGDKWCIYPMYDFAHGTSDAIEDITHSLCTLEFQDHRPLYDWFNQKIFDKPLPHQYEFAKLQLTHTLLSKRNLKRLVDEKVVAGWDDPRMPTLSGMRKRGFTPEAIRNFCSTIGVTKSESVLDFSILEEAVRDCHNKDANRAFAIISPIKVTFTNYRDDTPTEMSAPYHPFDTEKTRKLPFGPVVYIDADDFMQEPPAKYFRLKPGGEVRLRYSYVIKCVDVICDASGDVTELKCEIDYDTLGKKPEGRKVKGVIHWLEASSGLLATINEYDRLFLHESPNSAKTWDEIMDMINPNSCIVHENCLVEPNIVKFNEATVFQFERLGYYILNKKDNNSLVFNKTVALRDTWDK